MLLVWLSVPGCRINKEGNKIKIHRALILTHNISLNHGGMIPKANWSEHFVALKNKTKQTKNKTKQNKKTNQNKTKQNKQINK